MKTQWKGDMKIKLKDVGRKYVDFIWVVRWQTFVLRTLPQFVSWLVVTQSVDNILFITGHFWWYGSKFYSTIFIKCIFCSGFVSRSCQSFFIPLACFSWRRRSSTCHTHTCCPSLMTALARAHPSQIYLCIASTVRYVRRGDLIEPRAQRRCWWQWLILSP